MGGKEEKSAISVWRVRLGYLFRFFGRVSHYGFVPVILYLGLRLGQTDPNMPEIGISSLFFK